VHQFTGHYPPDPKEGKKAHKTLGVSSLWLRQCFNRCPQNVADEVIERYTRVWLWHMVACFLLLTLLGTPSPGWCYHSSVRHGRTSPSTVGGLPLSHGCISNYVRDVGGAGRLQTSAAAPTCFKFRFGSTSQLGGHIEAQFQ
jgi:hypothetical protein